MKLLKLFNIALALICLISVWFTDTLIQNKIVVTVFLSLVIFFWLAAKGKSKFDNYKIIG